MADQENTANGGCLPAIIIAAGILIAGGLLRRRLARLPMAQGRLPLLGIPVDAITMEQALTRIDQFIASRTPHHILTADASGLLRAEEEPEFHAMVAQADLVTPDGAGVMLAAEFAGVRLPERVSGVDLVERIAERAAHKGYLLYFFGAAEGVAEAAVAALKTRYPGLTVAGIRNGFFSAEEEPKIVREISTAHADVLFVALGIPKQEEFIRRHFMTLQVPVMIGIGGSFDVIGGKLERAPQWMQRMGLEWLFRLVQEPKRLPRLVALPKFILAAWRKRQVH